MNKTENTSSQSSSSTVSVRRAGNPARSTPVLPFYNAARWKSRCSTFSAMGTNPTWHASSPAASSAPLR